MLLKPLGLGSLSQQPQKGSAPGLQLARFCSLEVNAWSPGLGRRFGRVGFAVGGRPGAWVALAYVGIDGG